MAGGSGIWGIHFGTGLYDSRLQTSRGMLIYQACMMVWGSQKSPLQDKAGDMKKQDFPFRVSFSIILLRFHQDRDGKEK